MREISHLSKPAACGRTGRERPAWTMSYIHVRITLVMRDSACVEVRSSRSYNSPSGVRGEAVRGPVVDFR